MNKRGSIQDVFFFTVFVVGLAMFMILVHYIANDVSGKLLETTLNESENARTALQYTEDVTAQFDPIWLFLFIALLIGVLISSFMIHSYQIFIPIYIILLGITVVVGVIMNNIYLEFTATATLATIAATHTFSNAIINNYVPVIIGVGILSMIIIFARPTGAGRI